MAASARQRFGRGVISCGRLVLAASLGLCALASARAFADDETPTLPDMPLLPEPLAHSSTPEKPAMPPKGVEAKSRTNSLQALNKNPTLAEVRRKAEAGDVDAQYLVGYLFLVGEGVPLDREMARRWMRRAAERGDPRAQNGVGLLNDPLWFGKRDEASVHEAADWYRRAAQQGFLPALHNLQTMKDRKLVADALPAPLALERAALSTPDSRARAMSAAGEFRGEQDLDEARDARGIFTDIAPSVAEVIGDGNYGSGVAVGRLKSARGGYVLETPSRAAPVPYTFFSRGRKEPVKLEGEMMAVLTNRHVLQGSNRVRVGLGSKENGETVRAFSISGVCLADDAEFDVALMFVPLNEETRPVLSTVKPVPIYAEKHPPSKGSVVFALGNPEKLPRTITQGLFNGERTEGLQFDAPISKGSSGGALLDAQGRLLGLTLGFAAAEGSQNLNFAIPYKALSVFLSGKGMHCYVP